MPYNPNIHHRRSIRLKGYNYAESGSYFVTICTYQRHCLFGEIVDNNMKLNTDGETAKASWLSIPRHFPNVKLDELVVMPNHLHGIITIVEDSSLANQDCHRKQERSREIAAKGEALPMQDCQHQYQLSRQCFAPTARTASNDDPIYMPKGTKPQSLAAIIQNFKAVSTRKINRINRVRGNIIWQRDYYEHIIRDEKSLNNIRQYIFDNPLNWTEDEENPINLKIERSHSSVGAKHWRD